MDKVQKEIITANRVELVENITVKDGLYSQLIQKKVLSQRTVNRIKGAGVDEQQVEELLNELMKRDCFELFCQALIDDTQVDVVKKYLKPPAVQTTSPTPVAAPDPISVHTSSQQPTQPQPEPLITTDCASGMKRVNASPPPTAVLCIRENDNEHLILQYAQPPKKIPRQEDPVFFENDETRYHLKHFVSEDVILESSHVLNNSQTLTNPNITDPQRYAAAFLSSPGRLKGSDQNEFTLGISKDKNVIDSQSIRNLLRPQNTFQISNIAQQASSKSNFIRIGQESSSPNAKITIGQMGVLSSQTPRGVQETLGPGSDGDSVDNVSVLSNVMPLQQTHLYSLERVLLRDKQTAEITRVLPEFISDKFQVPAGFEEDMSSIDLPDGCVNVRVEHSTKQFFISNLKKSYPMQKVPRGLGLIINVDEVEGKPPRKGTNFDRDNLCSLLTQLHFNILVYNDKDGLTALDIVNKLKAFAKMKEHAKNDACFICLLSHGEEGYIFGTDGKRIPLEEIFMLFGNTNCKGLIGKPKIFIIQACRGGYLDKGVLLDEPDGGPVASKEGTQLPSMSDMLICYPTQTGYYAWRNRARGSWYIEAIVQVFMRFAKNEDICAMLNRVNYLVSRKVSECNQKEMNSMSQMSEFKSTLRRPHLFFFPGISVSVNQEM